MLLAAALLCSALAACGGSPGAASTATHSASAPVDLGVKSATRPVYRFAKLSNGAYFYTGDPVEKSLIEAQHPEFRYEGVVFDAVADGDGLPVYRFANTINGGYFYTADAAESALVRTDPRFAHFRFEGASFSVAAPAASGTASVYRLANLRNGAYLYTAHPAEVAHALALGHWRLEGMHFQVPTAAAGGTSVPPPVASGPQSAFINVGGSAYTAGDAFAADSAAAGGTPVASGTPIAGTTREPLYQTQRQGSFTYAIPLADGDYELTLHLAEIDPAVVAPGQRVFDVVLETGEPGARRIAAIDVWSQAGAFTARDLTRPVTVRGGRLDLQTVARTGLPAIAAISVRPDARTAPIPSTVPQLRSAAFAALRGAAVVDCAGAPTLFQIDDTHLRLGATAHPLAAIDRLYAESLGTTNEGELWVNVYLNADSQLSDFHFVLRRDGSLRYVDAPSRCTAQTATRWGAYDGDSLAFVNRVYRARDTYAEVRLACEHATYSWDGSRTLHSSIYRVGQTSDGLGFADLGSPPVGDSVQRWPWGEPDNFVTAVALTGDELIQTYAYPSPWAGAALEVDAWGTVRGARASLGRYGPLIHCPAPAP